MWLEMLSFVKNIDLPLARPLRVLCVVMLVATAVSAQSGRAPVQGQDPGQPVDKDDVIRVRTDEVMVPVSVRDSEGKRIEGLTPTDFMIFDNGTRQQIAGFNRERTPVNVLLLLDASGSVFEHMRFIREAAVKFVGELRPVDSVCILQFADDVELLQDWTSAENRSAISKALNWRYHPGESTSFYDGIYLAAKDRMSKVTGRKIIILLTDGIDSPKIKHATKEQSVSALKFSEAALYVISLTAILRRSVDQQAGTSKTARILSGVSSRVVRQAHQVIDQAEDSLDSMANATGGDMFLPLKDDELAPALQAISEELRSQYIITYRPSPAAKAGEWRNIKVLVKTGGLEVQARDGYRGRD
jgi:VWFA-related protein